MERRHRAAQTERGGGGAHVAPVLGFEFIHVRRANERAGEQLDHERQIGRLVPAVKRAQRALERLGRIVGRQTVRIEGDVVRDLAPRRLGL